MEIHKTHIVSATFMHKIIEFGIHKRIYLSIQAYFTSYTNPTCQPFLGSATHTHTHHFPGPKKLLRNLLVLMNVHIFYLFCTVVVITHSAIFFVRSSCRFVLWKLQSKIALGSHCYNMHAGWGAEGLMCVCVCCWLYVTPG